MSSSRDLSQETLTSDSIPSGGSDSRTENISYAPITQQRTPTFGPDPEKEKALFAHARVRTDDSLLGSYSRDPNQGLDEALNIARPNRSSREFAKRNLKRLLRSGLARCVLSWCLITGFHILSWQYRDQVISPSMKSRFDVITVALSIAFGLNIAAGLRENALSLRWWIVSFRKRPPQTVDLILHCDDFLNIMKLVVVAKERTLVFSCLFWLLLNVLVQVGIAVLGLTFEAVPGVGDIFLRPGQNDVSIPNMESFARPSYFSEEQSVQSYSAHVLGDVGSSFNFSALPDEPLEGKPWASNPASFWKGNDYWEYVFLDSAPFEGSANPRAVSVYSNRVVRSSAKCVVPPFNATLEGDLEVIHAEGSDRNVSFPSIATLSQSIYYLTRPVLSTDGSESGNGTCGPGCSSVQIFEPRAGPAAEGTAFYDSFFYYDCNVTVSSNTPELSARNAAVAAQAIGLSGQVHSEFFFANGSEMSNQFVAYNFGLPFGTVQNNSATGMAEQLSRFAIGVVAAAAQTNPAKVVDGAQPAQGFRLEMELPVMFSVILGLIGGVQLALVIATAWVCRQVEMPEEVDLARKEEIRRRYIL
ncbi:hypothetical protein BDY21DRAFT_338696 [Lineolata rhizophorae]|uniref:Uncharacterized protein n=1 Tax=Lineolata rhizophorae TaxID=578093 RepID=A0A6A6P835_9PEZI|nr:hypothetical protein BDY21DRAFT_338696 [Lineolata rhizophorae]